MFSVVHNVNVSARELNDDLKKINKWAFQWKMGFNPDPSQQAQEIIFSHKIKKLPHPSLVFSNNNVLQTSSQKHLGVTLDVKLTFDEHFNNVLNKVNKTIALLRKLQNLLSRSTLITTYKTFVRPHFAHGDVFFDQTYNNSFHEKLESIKHNACLYLTGAIRGSSKEKIYQELGFESLRVRRWYRELCLFYKVLNNEHPQYLSNLIPVRPTLYPTRNALSILLLNANHNFFKNSFFPSTIIEWNIPDPGLRKAESLSLFKTNILKFIRPSPNSVYNCYNPKGLKFITRLSLRLSHLREHKFKHSFQDTINPLCSCGLDIGSTEHFLLHCPQFVNEIRTLLSAIGNINYKLLENTDSNLTQTLLFGNTLFDITDFTKILNATINFILLTKRFDESLF